MTACRGPRLNYATRSFRTTLGSNKELDAVTNECIHFCNDMQIKLTTGIHLSVNAGVLWETYDLFKTD